MADLSAIKEHMEVIGADGVHLGTVDKVEGDRIKLTRADSGSHGDHHHYLSIGLVADIEEIGSGSPPTPTTRRCWKRKKVARGSPIVTRSPRVAGWAA